MKISELFTQKDPVVSFEIFPPKPDSPFEPVLAAVKRLSALRPDFISVTYGAAGGNRGRTLQIAGHIKESYGITPLAHLTCIASEPPEISLILGEMKKIGLENILALRGDPPQDAPGPPRKVYAAGLVRQIRAEGDFCLAAAAYPEGHPECPDKKRELAYLKEKILAGVDFLITQIFFDNEFFFDLLTRLNKEGVSVPVCAGVMPVFSRRQIERICSLCGASIPAPLAALMERYGNEPASMQAAGLEYAARQIDGLLAQKARGVHLYTMNRPELAEAMIRDTGLR
jgi:methylenetetrahydrofolate reductase (NADPH)